MPNVVRFTEDFLLPALNNNKYGDRLKWAEEKDVILVKWHHKGANSWSEDDTEMFQDWDKMKGHYNPALQNYLCQSKQRFRSVLYKLREFQELGPLYINSKCYYKRYQFVRSNIVKGKRSAAHSMVPDLDRDVSPSSPTDNLYCDNDHRYHHSPLPSSLPSTFYLFQNSIADTAAVEEEQVDIKPTIDLVGNLINFNQAQPSQELDIKVERKYEPLEDDDEELKFMSDDEVSSNLLLLGDVSFDQLLNSSTLTQMSDEEVFRYGDASFDQLLNNQRVSPASGDQGPNASSFLW